MANKIQKGTVVFHEIVSEKEGNRQQGIKLFEQLDKLFKANGVNTLDLRKAQEEFINE